ncbi:MAG: hypothetical protein HUK24_08460, partial [Sphaerochaetaceae bacterium]|nr:hypothetical protein [Sphaerochaetaceae bacterium]
MEHAYILLGPETGLKEDFINELKKQIGPCDISKFYAFDDYEGELYAQLNNCDLFADHKLVILDEAQEIKTKDKIKLIADYVANPTDFATLIILSTELYIASEIMDAAQNPKEQIRKFYELFDSDKIKWLNNYFTRNNFAIDQRACNAIIEKVDNNLKEFENTCSQMAIYFKTIV